MFCLFCASLQANDELPPDTGVSGVYEVMIGTDNPKQVIEFFTQFGFSQINKGDFSQAQAKALYGVDSRLTSYRLQNHDIDSHGLIRVLHWHNLQGAGVGYAQPETIGQRMMVMRTKDVFFIHDIFSDARKSGEPWLATPPVYDDLYGMSDGELNVINRRVGVREMGVYGELVNLVFYQRYGYTIPGYGSINAGSPLASSEITHNDFILSGHSREDMLRQTNYYRDVFGFKPEGDVVLDGDWQQGPKTVFNMADGSSHWYRGFVSPNNISGKLKFFVNPDKRPDRSAYQAPGQAGITLHSVYTDKVEMIHQLAQKEQLKITEISENEFAEKAFVLSGPDGATWQVIATPSVKKQPLTKLELIKK
ncbi:hypothetical protein E2K93_09425 [Thalassotalea sp. HSM 43]|nr:hypothetical protein E2K93_09425 [Thalassotalea sp. HSM 43]